VRCDHNIAARPFSALQCISPLWIAHKLWSMSATANWIHFDQSQHNPLRWHKVSLRGQARWDEMSDTNNPSSIRRTAVSTAAMRSATMTSVVSILSSGDLTAYSSSLYLVSLCSGFTSRSASFSRPQAFCDSHHCTYRRRTASESSFG